MTLQRLILSLWFVLAFSLACAQAYAEPAECHYEEDGTICFLDIHNRSWLAVQEVETLLTFYDAAGQIVYQDLVFIDFEDPIPAQHHEEIFLNLPNLRRFRPVRVEVSYSY